uniref:Uncharacterized protein n=1 Tax=Rousettus aegyptiacus TaxID=9407 RepID=A0A7J8BT99_ROUAE|nr:hypothetical protein HJG63_009663 [Rousettus aegyptiacus]
MSKAAGRRRTVTRHPESPRGATAGSLFTPVAVVCVSKVEASVGVPLWSPNGLTRDSDGVKHQATPSSEAVSMLQSSRFRKQRGAKYTDCESDLPNHLWVHVAARPPPGLPISPDTCPDAGTFESQTAPPGPPAAGIAPSGLHAGPATKWTPRGPRSSPRRPGEVAAGAARRGSEV